ncbi:uncharacterized protein LOC115455704 isoform X2 [Manduca sexta]|uniref:uncharacterized protein LOC115455704 isoform X2 n=1 Tax=Manduca sexta TaxID=7130 RepID=UPI00188E3C62|nr:uncharacterized protein LOC115455704 isoform X2 [Manduca sexta]
MYRTFLLVLLSTNAAIGAPQESRDSSITYLKIQPGTDKPVDTPNYRSYGFVPKNAKKSSKTSSIIVSDAKNLSITEPEAKIKPEHESNQTDKPNVTSVPEIVQSVTILNQNVSDDQPEVIDSKKSEASEIEKTNIDPNIEEIKEHKNLLKDTFENLDNLEPSQFDRHSRDYDYTTNTYDSSETEVADYSTEKSENLDSKTSNVSPKLTYFQKYGGSFSHNLIESSGKRRFRSRCRCEKIWNCPKLQITVPRCPEEYFMCCF